jgi:hypothetical protein
MNANKQDAANWIMEAINNISKEKTTLPGMAFSSVADCIGASPPAGDFHS